MEFNWEEFMDKDNNIAVHCKTEEEAIDFCKQMDAHGMKWKDGDRYLEKNNWRNYREKTCYNNQGEYGRIDGVYKEKNYKILEWSNYMIKNPIDYLEYGYVVEFENGKLGMYMPSQNDDCQNGDCFDLEVEDSCLYLKNYSRRKELKQYIYSKSSYDVFKIYGYARYGSDSRKLSIQNRPFIWERPKEVKKMTVSEICKELGYKVEIIAEEK